jgi:hypothetical protein
LLTESVDLVKPERWFSQQSGARGHAVVGNTEGPPQGIRLPRGLTQDIRRLFQRVKLIRRLTEGVTGLIHDVRLTSGLI